MPFELRNDVKQSLEENGSLAVITIASGSVYNPETRRNVSTSTNYDVYIAPLETVNYSMINGTLIKAGDFKCMLAADDLPQTIEPGKATLLLNGQTYQVIALEEQIFKNITLFWNAVVRK